MNSEEFRQLALAVPGAAESAHMGHPDFRIKGKIFATLYYPDENWGMVKLSPEQQNELLQKHSDVFVPAKGAWGRKGSTLVRLAAISPPLLEKALRLARSRHR